ncbi:MAG: hypothetical protein K9I85_13580 [Saprospiraceae bacterium]|nr:hypothetical protein [Saprospiraceae bacterium]
MRHWLAITFTIFITLPGLAATFYLDPVNGSLNNPGTLAAPWPSLEEVILANLVETQEYAPLPYDLANSKLIPKNVGAPAHAGDILVLLNRDQNRICSWQDRMDPVAGG